MLQEFIEAIDGIDNGISQYPADSVARYTNRTDLSTRVSWLNPSWNEPCDAKTVDVCNIYQTMIDPLKVEWVGIV